MAMVKKQGGIYKKLHRWPGLIISFLLLFYGVTGILMNHREWLAGIDVDRDGLPGNYHYKNWNNAALKGSLILSPDSILVYGNIGIWLTDSTFTEYTSYNQGLPEGSDHRKIFDVHLTPNGSMYAATLFGLWGRDEAAGVWKKFDLETDIDRFTGIESIDDSVFVMSRSYLFSGTARGTQTLFERKELPAPEGYAQKVTLFETIWQIHSGEILGLPGKLFVDLLGVVTIFLSLTGMVYFFFPSAIRRFRRKEKSAGSLVRVNRWSLKWHNKVGAWLFILLIVLYFTGMFLRPPLLIAIASARVAPLKFTHLDQPNPWYDKLRDLRWDESRGIFLVSTSEGMFSMSRNSHEISVLPFQPPVSVMGINTFEPLGEGRFLVGSFSGLFLWNPDHPAVYDYVTGEAYQEPSGGRPVGDLRVTGHIIDPAGRLYVAEYGYGLMPVGHQRILSYMPQNVREESGISLWNLTLEIHTGRIFEFLLGGFYILIVPLTGLTAVTVVLSGYLLWKRKYKRRK